MTSTKKPNPMTMQPASSTVKPNPAPIHASQMLHDQLRKNTMSTPHTPAAAPAAAFIPTIPSYKFAALRKRQQLFVDGLINAGYSGDKTNRRAVVATAAALGYPASFPWPSWMTADMGRRLDRGVFLLPELAERVIERNTLKTLPAGYALDPSNAGCMIAITTATV